MRFDPLAYTLAELRNAFSGIHLETHALAAAYGWPEEAILALPRGTAPALRVDHRRRAVGRMRARVPYLARLARQAAGTADVAATSPALRRRHLHAGALAGPRRLPTAARRRYRRRTLPPRPPAIKRRRRAADAAGNRAPARPATRWDRAGGAPDASADLSPAAAVAAPRPPPPCRPWPRVSRRRRTAGTYPGRWMSRPVVARGSHRAWPGRGVLPGSSPVAPAGPASARTGDAARPAAAGSLLAERRAAQPSSCCCDRRAGRRRPWPARGPGPRPRRWTADRPAPAARPEPSRPPAPTPTGTGPLPQDPPRTEPATR